MEKYWKEYEDDKGKKLLSGDYVDILVKNDLFWYKLKMDVSSV